ncbi:MAG: efflux RND transporter permease subunit [Proteobacteria bacterium]|nr:efflux RND transporter permease subunit [Pseudomonadota bacterium]
MKDWIAHHRRSLLRLLLLPAIAGLAAAVSLPVTLFPNVAFPRVRLTLDAGDRPAEQMALQVTTPVEQAVHGVPNVVDVRSTTSRGTAELSIFFNWGTDMVAATLQIDAAIEQIRSQLPPGTISTTRRMDPTVFPIIAYSLTSANVPLTKLRDLALYQLRPLLVSVPGVARIGVTGGSDEEYHVLVDPAKLMAYGLTSDDVAKAVSTAHVISAVGRLEDHYKLYLVVADNRLNSVGQIEHIAVRTSADGVVTVGDVATVERSTVPQWIRVTADGKDAILFNIYQQPGGNSVAIAKAVKQRLSAFHLPQGVALANWYDQSELVVASAVSVRDATLIGIGLAALVLLLFLRSWRITVIAVLVVPAALSATVVLLYALGMSFNIMTLGGMAAAVGLIIDDAIVMVEHIVRRQDAHRGRGSGVLDAAAEFAKPLAGSSAATIVIFVPLAFLTGVTGAFFKALSLTMASALLFSFALTLLAVPLATDWLLGRRTGEPERRRGAGAAFMRWYGRLLIRLLRHPAIALLGVVPLLVAGWLAFNAVGTGFMPTMDEGGFILDYYSAPGTALSETDRLLRQVDAILAATPEVETWSRRTGAGLGGDLSEANKGDYFIRLKAGPRRSIDEVMATLRQKIASDVPGLTIEMAQLMEDLIGDLTAVPQPIEVKLFGDDATILARAAKKVAATVAKIQGVVDIRNGINPAGDALDIQVDRNKAAFEGIDPNEATRLIGLYLQGQVVTQVLEQVKQLGVRIWTTPTIRGTDRDVGNLLLRAADGHVFPVKRIASLVPIIGQPQIGRENLQRMDAVTARIEGRDLGSVAADVQHMLAPPGFLPNTVRYELGGLYQQQQIAFAGLTKVFVAAVTMVFLLILFLYEDFKVACSILPMPLLATCAVFIGLWLTRIELNISAMMGMTMIVGIVTEVAIFYFSEVNDLQKSGQGLAGALVKAGQSRMRPIVMTTLAAILTLIPLALALGQGAAMQQPLAIAIVSGLAIQLPLVLLVMPALFVSLGKAKNLFESILISGRSDRVAS